MSEYVCLVILLKSNVQLGQQNSSLQFIYLLLNNYNNLLHKVFQLEIELFVC